MEKKASNPILSLNKALVLKVILSKKFIHNGVQGFMEILLVFIATKEKSKKQTPISFPKQTCVKYE